MGSVDQHASHVATDLKASGGRSTVLVLVILTALYTALVAVEMRRYLWFDEILTYEIAKTHDYRQLWELVHKWDLNPPLTHVLAHWALSLSGGNPLAVRLPSALEFFFASLFLGWYTGRKLGREWSVLPVLLLWYSQTFFYAVEARPYAALCFWFAAMLLLYDVVLSGQLRKASRWLLGLANAGLLSSHVLAPFSLVPFVVAEVVRCRRLRKTDWGLWAALLSPLLLVFFYLPLYESYKSIVFFPPAFQASVMKLGAFYWHAFRDVAWVMAVALLAAWLVQERFHPKRVYFPRLNIHSLSRLRIPNFALFCSIALTPILVDFVLMYDRSPFWGRYCITTSLAVYFLFALPYSWIFGHSRRAAYVASLVAFTFLVVKKVGLPIYDTIVDPPAIDARMFANIKPELPIVSASGLTFVEMGQHESPQLMKRVYYLSDREAAIEFAHATLFEDMSDFQHEFELPGTVENYRSFIRQHPHFLVYGTRDYPEDWLLRKLVADHASLRLIGRYRLPYKDSALYDVVVRSETPGVKPAPTGDAKVKS